MTTTDITLGGGATAATPGSLQIIDSDLFTLKWGDSTYNTERAQKMRYVLMPQAQWDQGVADHLAAHPTSLAVRRWIHRIQQERSEYASMQTCSRIPVDTPDSDEVDFRLWKEMIENPCQYGDDIVEWLDLDAKVMAGPKRWRAAAFWQVKEDEYTAKEWERVLGLLAKAAEQQRVWHEEALAKAFAHQSALATRIQAAWRGYATRTRQTWRDCALCLKHGICVEQVEDQHVCRSCWGEENPVEDD